MPEIIRYNVTETRVVKVQANNIEDACRIAAEAFARSVDERMEVVSVPGVWGTKLGHIEIVSMLAERTT